MARGYRIENADGKVWLLPHRGLRTGLELYQPSGIKGRLLKRLFPLLHRLPPVRKIAHASTAEIELDDDTTASARYLSRGDRNTAYEALLLLANQGG